MSGPMYFVPTPEQVAAARASTWAELIGTNAAHIEITDAMALAFHQAISDSCIGQDDVDDTKIGLRAALVNYTLAAQAAPTHQQIAAYLQETGAYITNDASREAVIADAIAEDRLLRAQAATIDAEPVGRTEVEIVAQTETLARYLLSWKWGLEPDSPKTKLRNSQNHKAQKAWNAACEIQDLLTATDVENAVAEVDDATRAAQGGAA